VIRTKRKKKTKLKICDDLWKQLVLQKANHKCEHCGKAEGVQAHHIIPRTNYSLRHDPENGVALCIRHHLYWAHKDALQFTEWISGKRNLEYLESRRYNKSKNDYNLIEIYLKQQIGERQLENIPHER